MNVLGTLNISGKLYASQYVSGCNGKSIVILQIIKFLSDAHFEHLDSFALHMDSQSMQYKEW